MKIIYKANDGREFNNKEDCRKYETASDIKLSIIDNPDLTNLKSILIDYVNFIKSDDYHEDNDYENYIVETVLETFFENFYEWKNNFIN